MPSRSRLPALFLAALLVVAAARPSPAQGPSGADLGQPVRTAPVELDGKVLYRVRGVTAYPAEARAAAIADRIREAADNPGVDPAKLRLEERDGRTEIRTDDVLVAAVVDADARLEGVSRGELAVVYLGILRNAIEEYRAARATDRLAIAAARAAASTVLVVAFILLVRFVFRRLDRLIVRRFRGRIEALEARSFEMVRAERIRALIRGGVRSARVLLVLAALFLYVQHVLGLFPWTRPVAVRLGAWLLDPLRIMWRAFVGDIPDLIFLVVLAVVVHYVLKLTKLFFDGIGRGTIRFEGFDPDWAPPTLKIARIAIVAFALVIAYPYIPGSGSEAFKGVSLFLGVVFSLGSSSVISNMIAGFAMTYRRAFKVGDRVKIGSVVGEVTEARLQVTHVRTPKNEEVVVPNSMVLNTEVTNYSTLAQTRGLILHTTVGIGYEVPWRQVEAMLLQAAGRTAGLEPEPRPFVLQRALGDFAVSYEINAYCRTPADMWSVYSDLHRHIQDVFNEYGVQIMTPNYVADTPEAKLVPREQWYAAPAKPPDGDPKT